MFIYVALGVTLGVPHSVATGSVELGNVVVTEGIGSGSDAEGIG